MLLGHYWAFNSLDWSLGRGLPLTLLQLLGIDELSYLVLGITELIDLWFDPKVSYLEILLT